MEQIKFHYDFGQEQLYKALVVKVTTGKWTSCEICSNERHQDVHTVQHNCRKVWGYSCNVLAQKIHKLEQQKRSAVSSRTYWSWKLRCYVDALNCGDHNLKKNGGGKRRCRMK